MALESTGRELAGGCEMGFHPRPGGCGLCDAVLRARTMLPIRDASISAAMQPRPDGLCGWLWAGFRKGQAIVISHNLFASIGGRRVVVYEVDGQGIFEVAEDAVADRCEAHTGGARREQERAGC